MVRQVKQSIQFSLNIHKFDSSSVTHSPTALLLPAELPRPTLPQREIDTITGEHEERLALHEKLLERLERDRKL
jgi:hypothetical protein